MKRILPLHLSFLIAITASCSLTSAAYAQVNGPGISDSSLFDTVFNIPDDPDFGSGSFLVAPVGGTAQLNLSEGGAIGNVFNTIREVEINISGGTVGSSFRTSSGTESVSYTHLTLPTICSV